MENNHTMEATMEETRIVANRRAAQRMAAEAKAERIKLNSTIGLGEEEWRANPDTVLPAIIESMLEGLGDHADTLRILAEEERYQDDVRPLFLAEMITIEVAELRRLNSIVHKRLADLGKGRQYTCNSAEIQDQLARKLF